MSYFYGSSIFVETFSKNTQIPNFLKFRKLEAEFWNRTDRGRDRQSDRHNEANSHFSLFCKRPCKSFKFLSFYCFHLDGRVYAILTTAHLCTTKNYQESWGAPSREMDTVWSKLRSIIQNLTVTSDIIVFQNQRLPKNI